MKKREGAEYSEALQRTAPLAPFIEDPRAARAMGALPLRPPTKSGKPFEGASRR